MEEEEEEEGGHGFVQPDQGFQKQAQPTTMSPSVARVLLMLLPRGGGTACLLCSMKPPPSPEERARATEYQLA